MTPSDQHDHGLKRARLVIHDALTALMNDKSVHLGAMAAALTDELAWLVAIGVKEGRGLVQVEEHCQQLRDQFALYAADSKLSRPDGWGSPLPS